MRKYVFSAGSGDRGPGQGDIPPPMTPGDQGQGWHLASQCRDLDLRSAGAGDLIQFIQIPHFNPRPPLIVFSPLAVIFMIQLQGLKRGKLEKLLANLLMFDNGHVFQVFKDHC